MRQILRQFLKQRTNIPVGLVCLYYPSVFSTFWTSQISTQREVTNQHSLPTRIAQVHMSELFRSDLSSDNQWESLLKFETETVFWHFERACLFVFGATAPSGPGASSFTSFVDYTQRRTTVGRTPLDEWSARRWDFYLTKHHTHNKHPCPGGIRTHNLSRRTAADLRFRPRGHWDLQ